MRRLAGKGQFSFNIKQKTGFSVYYCKIKKNMYSNKLAEIKMPRCILLTEFLQQQNPASKTKCICIYLVVKYRLFIRIHKES